MRSLCGIGSALISSNLVALIGITFPQDKERKVGLSLFGAMAPVGIAVGALAAAVIIQLSSWKWLFVML